MPPGFVRRPPPAAARAGGRAGAGPPAQVGARGEDAEPRAGRVDERAVEVLQLRRQSGRVGLDDVHVRRAQQRGVVAQLTGAPRVQLDGRHLAREHRRLPSGRRARVEDPLPLARPDDESRELRPAALRPNAAFLERPVVDPVDAVRAGHIGRLARRVAPHQPDHGFGRLVLRAHQCERRLLAEVAAPRVVDPVGVRVLERSSGSEPSRPRRALGQAAHDGVRERDRTLDAGATHELDRVVDHRVRRLVRVAELVRAEPERREHGWIELADRAASDRLDRVVERADALHRAVREPLREGAVAVVEVGCEGAERAVRVRLVLEHAPDDGVRDASRRRDHRRPLRNSSYVMRRPPSGCTSSGTSSRSSTRARQIVIGRPSSSARAPMCGESARIRRSASAGSARSSCRSAASSLWAYVGSPSCS